MTSSPPDPDHKTREHAVCSASGAERWLNCPGSIALSEGIPDEPSGPEALEGTRAHELSERILRDWEAKGRKLDAPWIESLRAEYRDTEVQTGDGRLWSMLDYSMTYVNVCLDQVSQFDEEPTPPAVRIEHRMVLDADLGLFGTGDFLITGIQQGKETGVVVDLKYGRSKVTTKNNKQLQFYATALRKSSKRALEVVKVVVVQPRLAHFYCEHTYSIEELLAVEQELLKGAEKAVRQVAGFEPKELNMGRWCYWCKARFVCPEKVKAKADVFELIAG